MKETRKIDVKKIRSINGIFGLFKEIFDDAFRSVKFLISCMLL